LGLGGWAPTPNPQSPIPNPQSPFYLNFLIYLHKQKSILLLENKNSYLKLIKFKN